MLCFRFLTDHRRLNVAITRAKRALYIIGHLRTFQFNKHWNNLISYAEKQNVIVRVDENMSCVKECLNIKPNASVCVSRSLVSTEDKDKYGQIQSDSSHNIVTKESNAVLTTKKQVRFVDKSAFSLQRKSTKYIDPLPNSKAFKNRNMSTNNKQKLSSSTEVKSKDQLLQASQRKRDVPPTEDKHRNSSSKHVKLNITIEDKTVMSAKGNDKAVKSPKFLATDMKQVSGPNCRKEFMPKSASNMSERIMQTNTKESTTVLHTTVTLCSATISSTSTCTDNNLVSNTKTSTDRAISNVLSNPGVSVNNQSPSSSRKIDMFTYGPNDNRAADRWGGQRKRISHYSNKQQVRKRHHECEPKGSKKARHN